MTHHRKLLLTDKSPTRLELFDLLDDVSAALQTMLLQYGADMHTADRNSRSSLCNVARALCDRELREQHVEEVTDQAQFPDTDFFDVRSQTITVWVNVYEHLRRGFPHHTVVGRPTREEADKYALYGAPRIACVPLTVKKGEGL